MLVEYAFSFALQISVHSQDSKLRGAVSYVAPGDGGHVAHGDGEFFLKKTFGGCGSVAVPPPPRTSCRPRQGIWRGGGTTTLPQPPRNSLIVQLVLFLLSTLFFVPVALHALLNIV
jgi:hypothetical protein